MIRKSVLIPLLSLFILSLLLGVGVSGQNTTSDSLLSKIKNGKDWRVYSSSVASPATVSLDSLAFFWYTSLNSDSVKMFLRDISVIPKEREPVWMGMWVGSYQAVDGKRRKVLISVYGGFFMDTESGRYIVLSMESRNDWVKYITQCLANLSGGGKN